MENRNDKEQLRELDPEQLEKASGGVIKERVCTLCGKTFYTQSRLETHIKFEHQVKEPSILP